MERYDEKYELSTASSGTSGTSSSESDFSTVGKEADYERGFYWKSRYQHAMYFVTYTLSWGLISSYRNGRGIKNSEDVPTFVHMLLAYAIFAGPLLYLQVFIGQYTQRGCIVLGEMLPLAYGIGYCMLINTIISCSLNLYFGAAILHYIFVSMINYPAPSWMICLLGYRPSNRRCFSRDDIDLCKGCRVQNHELNPPCYNPLTDIFSAKLFQESVVFGKETIEGTLVSPKVLQVVNLFLITLIVLIISMRLLKDLNDGIHLTMIFVNVSILVTLVVILLNNPRLEFIMSMFYFNLNSVFKIDCWTQAFSTTALRLNIVDGGHLLFGSYMPLTVNCTHRVTYLLIIHLVYVLLANTLAFLMEDYLACSLNMKVGGLSRYSDFQTTFAIYPTALGILAAAQVWATIYFLVLFSLTLHTTVLQIVIVQETLSHEIIDSTYWSYTRVLLVAVVSIAAILYSSFGNSTFAFELFLHKNVIQFSIICLIYVVLFMYGLDRFSDDIQFILHSPPSSYLKWSWSLSAIVCFFILAMYFYQESYFRTIHMSGALAAVIFLPLPIGFLFQLIEAIRERELSALIKPSKSFGPADSEERANRRLFNPRFEVRFRRKQNFCKHRCLLGSVTLRKCVEKELALLNHVVVKLSDKEEESEIKKELLVVLRKHKEIMTNALKFDPTKEYFRNRSHEYKKV